MDRGRKRDADDEPPADKRACSSSEYRPCSSVASSSPVPLPPGDSEMESSSSSGRSDRGGDSGYGSCDSDDVGGGYNSRYILGKGRFNKVLAGLVDAGSGGSAQLVALTELCEVLSFFMEDVVGYLPVETVVPLLVKLSGHDSNPEVMLLAIRALTYLCDAMPRSADAIAQHGALPVLCRRLLAIEYLDVAEQCLQALEKISRKQPVACLQAGTINAVLTNIDFFSTSIQRVAVSTVANVCKKPPLDCSSIIMESLSTLCSLLQYDDRKLVETVATCLVRIADCFSCSSELLDELCKHGIIQNSLQLITNDGHRSLSQATYSGLIGILTKLATNSLVAVQTLFDLNVSRTLSSILMGSAMSNDSAYVSIDEVQTNQICEVIKLANQLIPPETRNDPDNQIMQAKEKILVDQPDYLRQFSMDILPASVQIVNSRANTYICYGCASIIKRIAYFCTIDMLLELIKSTNISSFLAGLLARKDLHVLFAALETVEILMQKLPGVFLSSFIKEGAVYAIDTLLLQEKCPESVLQQADDPIGAREISRCLCYAFASSKIPSSEAKTCRIGKDTMYNLGRRIRTTYFSHGAVNSEIGFSDALQNLKILCGILNDCVSRCLTNDSILQNEEKLTKILSQVMRELSQGECMSTFEFIESGIVRSLAHYLSNGRFLLGIPHDIDSSSHSLAVLKRFQLFSSICLSNPGKSWESMLLAVLLKKLQNALSSLDCFPVILSYGFKLRNTYADFPAGGTTKPCFKVQLVRDKEDSDLSDYSYVLNIDSSSSFDAVEGFLSPKVSENKNRHLKLKEPVDNNSSKAQDTASCFSPALKKNTAESHTKISHESYISNSSKVIRSAEEQSTPAGTSTKETMSGNEVAKGRTNTASPSTASAKPKLTFSLGGKQLDRSGTLYQAVLENQKSSESVMILESNFWSKVYKLTYKKAEEANNGHIFDWVPQSNVFLNKLGFSWQNLPFFPSMLQPDIPCKIDKSNPSYDILYLLKILEGLNHFSLELLTNERVDAFAEGRLDNFDDLKVTICSVPQVQLVNSKLTDKLEQQMQDPLTLTTSSFPLWCSQLMAACPFLFSFEARWKYFYLSTFGSLRNQRSSIQHTNFINERRTSAGYSWRKFKVDRNNILECAVKMMELHAQNNGPLEIEYTEEVGTGLGPTMEFFTIVSHELQRVGFGMWREDLRNEERCGTNGDSELVLAPFGLFPRPWSTTSGASGGVEFSEVMKKFLLLGRLVAKAIKDGRILDIPFSRAFYKIMLDQELTICDVQLFDPELGRALLEFQALVNRKKFLESTFEESDKLPSKLYYRNSSVKDLCLDFTLPGYTDYALFSDSTKAVSIANLEEYVSLVVDATISSGIFRQIEAFKSGFNEVFPLKTLQIFTEDELERLLCGEQDTLDFTELVDHIKFAHGYTANSPTAISLLEVIHEFERDQHRAFLQFVTGAPRLPPGGLAALDPKLTVVRKHCSCDADMELPSVMTCMNYLKLPPYSSKETMKQKVLYAITEGQGSFHLS